MLHYYIFDRLLTLIDFDLRLANFGLGILGRLSFEYLLILLITGAALRKLEYTLLLLEDLNGGIEAQVHRVEFVVLLQLLVTCSVLFLLRLEPADEPLKVRIRDDTHHDELEIEESCEGCEVLSRVH